MRRRVSESRVVPAARDPRSERASTFVEDRSQDERRLVAQTVAALLANHSLEDISVEDPPLEEVIAHVFADAKSEEATAE